LTLSAVRQLSSAQFLRLMDGPLALPLPRQSTTPKLTLPQTKRFEAVA
jgi:hypothetical protein